MHVQPQHDRLRRSIPWRAHLFAAAIIIVGLLIDRGGLFVLPVLFVLIVPFEKLFPRHKKQPIRRPLTGVDMSYALAAPVLNAVAVAVTIVVGVASLAWLPGLALRPLVSLIPPSISPFVGVALFDLAIYWAHRWLHEVPALWRFHAIHHSTEHLDWVSGLRNHPFDGSIVAPPFFFLIGAGFSATFTGALAVVQIVSGLFLHANVRWRLRPLHRIVITPEFHHWHHANEVDAHNTNYSVFLPLWDILFSTYYMPGNKRPLRYGVDEAVPATLIGQLGYPFARTRSIRQAAAHPWQATRSGARLVAEVVRDVWRSSTRPATKRPGPGELLGRATEPPTAQPGWPDATERHRVS